MAIFHFTDQAGRLLGVVSAPRGDEPTARELMAGKGKARDERFIGHDGGIECSQVDPEGPSKVLWRDEPAASAAETGQEPAAGAKPDNRGAE